MPFNTLRLNHQPSSHPNDRITFIKPLPRPPSDRVSYETADLLLRAIAAQCLPIMNSHHLSITTLEEHEPNSEFVGRNFNGGEIIQLVLRSRGGAWLDVRMIQMVMMHELAHNVHMNHKKAFWETRNKFAGEMRELWAKSYTGEGFWGGGRVLGDLESGLRQGMGVVGSEELRDLPLCGGTYRSRGRTRRRKRKDNGLTWKEKKERRIEKRFGKNGMALGEDEDKRLSLEINSKRPLGVKPRVAQSKRGRELRAAAALARFQTNKSEVKELEGVKKEDTATDGDSGSGSGSDYEDVDADLEDARDTNGRRFLDSTGKGMVKVCGDEDQDDVAVKQEMDELEGLDLRNSVPRHKERTRSPPTRHLTDKADTIPESLYDIPEHQESTPKPSSTGTKPPTGTRKPTISNISLKQPPSRNTTTASSRAPATSTTAPAPAPPVAAHDTLTCPICSLANPRSSATCDACAHVLDPRKDPRHWRCHSDPCRGSRYVNAGDAGVCGVCGIRRPA